MPIFLLFFIFLISCSSEQENSQTDKVTELVDTASTIEAISPIQLLQDSLNATPWDSAKVKRGNTFAAIMEDCSLYSEKKALVLNSLSQEYRGSIYPRQKFFWQKDSSDTSFTFKLLARNKHYAYYTHLQGDSILSWTDTLPLVKDTILVDLKLEYSLYQSFLDEGLNPSLLPMVVNLFSWNINFFHDPQKGDHFTALAERVHNSFGEFLYYDTILAARYVNYKDSTYTYWALPWSSTDSSGNEDSINNFYDSQGNSLRREFLKAPLNYSRISSNFNPRRLHPVLKRRRAHHGTDFAAPTGTPVLAAADGIVEYAKWVGGYGHTVKLKHPSDSLKSIATYYAHLVGYHKDTKSGREVKQGEVIGYVGSTGLSTGPHLDYRLEVNGQYVDATKQNWRPLAGLNQSEFDDFQKEFLKKCRSMKLQCNGTSIKVAGNQPPGLDLPK